MLIAVAFALFVRVGHAIALMPPRSSCEDKVFTLAPPDLSGTPEQIYDRFVAAARAKILGQVLTFPQDALIRTVEAAYARTLGQSLDYAREAGELLRDGHARGPALIGVIERLLADTAVEPLPNTRNVDLNYDVPPQPPERYGRL
jgi:hypothetical protein